MKAFYTTSTQDGPEYKSLICGRASDVTKLLENLSNGRSVALFGEKRIGKTSLLYLLRDIINGSIENYRANLLDLDLRQQIDSLRAKVPGQKAVYVDLHALDTVERKALIQLLWQELCNHGLVKHSAKERKWTIPQIFEAVYGALPNGTSCVMLVDEVEVLLQVPESEQIFSNLRSVIQSYSTVRFILAGQELWYKEIKDKTSPLVRNVERFCVGAATQSALREYLVTKPLRERLSLDSSALNEVSDVLLAWTECKPLYLQAACESLVETYESANNQLPRNWESVCLEKTKVHVKPHLDDFYNSRSLSDLAKAILALLANRPGLSRDVIAKKIGYSVKKVADTLSDLEALSKVRQERGNYRIVGAIIEEWGRETQEVPRTSRPLPQFLKWGVVVALLFSAVCVYWYSNPRMEEFQVKFPAALSGLASIRMPTELEKDEIGDTTVSAHNTGQTKVTMRVQLHSEDIEFRWEGSDRIAFDWINPDETKSVEVAFAARSPVSGTSFLWSAETQSDLENNPEKAAFKISERRIPIKKYWSLISALLVMGSSFVAKPEWVQLVVRSLSSLINSQSGKKPPAGSSE